MDVPPVFGYIAFRLQQYGLHLQLHEPFDSAKRSRVEELLRMIRDPLQRKEGERLAEHLLEGTGF